MTAARNSSPRTKRRPATRRWLAVVAIGLVIAGGAALAQDLADETAGAGETLAPVEEPATAEGPNLFDFSHWDPMLLWWLAPAGSVLALIFAWVFFCQVKKADEGDENMKAIAAYVREGAYAYLRRQYKVVIIFFVVAAAVLFVMGRIGVQHKIVWFAFLTGGFFSGLCGFWGMKAATLASNRTAQGAKESLNRGLTVAFRAGAVTGLVVVGFGLLYIAMWFLLLTKFAPWLYHVMGWGTFHMDFVEVTVVMLTFGMGASSQALFARVGGGIFTKGADVGADLVGKVEAGIPEDDPRNPATIADNVGDNVGDVAGMGADLYESYCASILAAAALGVAAGAFLGLGPAEQMLLLSAPMVLAGVGIVLSVLGIYLVRTKEGASMKQLMGSLDLGVNAAAALIIVAAGLICWLLLGGTSLSEAGVRWWGVWLSIISGLVAGVMIGKAAEFYTSFDYSPTKNIAQSAKTGPATVIISGIAEGMKSTWAPLLTVIIAIMAAYGFAGGFTHMPLGLYGIGIAAVGMLATLGITLSTDAYGPIADNAGGNAEMTHQDPEVRKRTDALDSLGNTTAATGKGFAIGSAALTALALLGAYMEVVRVGQNRQAMAVVLRHAPEAKTNAHKAVGEVFYLGHGKFGMKTKEGISKDCFTCFMAVDPVPASVDVGRIEPVLDTMPISAPITPDGRTTFHVPPLLSDKPTTTDVRAVSARTATLDDFMAFYNVTLINPKVLCGLFSGVLLVFLFSAMTMKAVGRVAHAMVNEVRRQFREIAGIMEGTAQPDYARCVEISAAGAQKAMIIPSLLALIVPVAVGLLLGVPGVLGLLAGGLTCGFAVAIFMANAGGAWDNAKKLIETGQYGGKGSDAHKAAVVGDTVGDPFKDTSGPSLNILIKLTSMVSIVFAGVVVKFGPKIASLLGMN